MVGRSGLRIRPQKRQVPQTRGPTGLDEQTITYLIAYVKGNRAGFPQYRFGLNPDAGRGFLGDPVDMQTSYAVTWQEGAGPIRHGKLELRPRALVLEGSDPQGPHRRDVAYDDVTNTHVVRNPSERLSGRPTLVVDRGSSTSFRIAGVAQPGMISELAENLAALRDTGERPHMSRLVIIVPLQPDARHRARALLAKGPPFDPDASGLERHHVFLTDDEAVFVFEADTQGAVERLASDPTLWEAVSGWNDLVAGPPRMAADVFSWVRVHECEAVSYSATPGPGDSDGGDVYAP